ncbi:MAG: hypothetical protein R3F55_20860 [Alphaproteobacteria bacterium]
MRDLDQALTDIAAMRRQMARGTEFRGYGPVAFGVTGLLAVATALVQAFWLSDPLPDAAAAGGYGRAAVRGAVGFVVLWGAAGLIAVAVMGYEVVSRARRVHVGLADAMIREAAAQMVPALVAGAAVTLVLLRAAPGALWLLPGLWQLLLSLGVFASRRSLPRPFLWVGVWYMACGLACLALAQGAHAFSPWAMAVPFGVGQFMAAALIHRSEPRHGDGRRP